MPNIDASQYSPNKGEAFIQTDFLPCTNKLKNSILRWCVWIDHRPKAYRLTLIVDTQYPCVARHRYSLQQLHLELKLPDGHDFLPLIIAHLDTIGANALRWHGWPVWAHTVCPLKFFHSKGREQ